MAATTAETTPQRVAAITTGTRKTTEPWASPTSQTRANSTAVRIATSPSVMKTPGNSLRMRSNFSAFCIASPVCGLVH